MQGWMILIGTFALLLIAIWILGKWGVFQNPINEGDM
jgi:hypothetical protein